MNSFLPVWSAKITLGMDRRKSLVYCGAEEEALREHDASFYGFSEAAVSSESPDDIGLRK